jgi:hypothetical protein
MNKIIYSLAILQVMFAFSGNAALVSAEERGERLIEKQGGFEIYGPQAWKIADTGLKYKIFRGPTDKQFTPNINFTDGEHDGSITEYIDAAIEIISQYFTNFILIERTSFTTNAGLKGRKIITEANLNQIPFRQSVYFFLNGKGKIMLITATSNQNNGAEYDAIFDESIRTFIWKK